MKTFRPSRRDFLRGSGLLFAAASAPTWIERVAFAAEEAATPTTPPVLVLVELAGGNDALNTVVPFADERYYRLRPKLAVPKDDVLKLDDHSGLHPAMKRLREVYERGQLAVVQNVGYPKPDRSHFRSQEIIATGEPDRPPTRGWLGRTIDAHPPQDRLPRLCRIGRPAPLAFAGDRLAALTLENAESLSLRTDDRHQPDRGNFLAALQEAYSQPRKSPYAAQLARALGDAAALSEKLKAAAKDLRPDGYPNTPLANALKLTAGLIHNGFGMLAYHVTHGGYDTHANQKGPHGNLLTQLSDALAAFQADLAARGDGARVVTLVHSEFGRRVVENGSDGTDHGAAGAMFVVGEGVKGGLYGGRPDLDKLIEGDLRHQVDFRQVYATLIRGLWGAEPKEALGAKFDALPFLAAAKPAAWVASKG